MGEEIRPRLISRLRFLIGRYRHTPKYVGDSSLPHISWPVQCNGGKGYRVMDSTDSSPGKQSRMTQGSVMARGAGSHAAPPPRIAPVIRPVPPSSSPYLLPPSIILRWFFHLRNYYNSSLRLQSGCRLLTGTCCSPSSGEQPGESFATRVYFRPLTSLGLPTRRPTRLSSLGSRSNSNRVHFVSSPSMRV